VNGVRLVEYQKTKSAPDSIESQDARTALPQNCSPPTLKICRWVVNNTSVPSVWHQLAMRKRIGGNCSGVSRQAVTEFYWRTGDVWKFVLKVLNRKPLGRVMQIFAVLVPADCCGNSVSARKI